MLSETVDNGYDEVLKSYCHARVGLIGNPSDGFCGKTLSFLLANFKAEVTLSPHQEPNISIFEEATFSSSSHLQTFSIVQVRYSTNLLFYIPN